MIYDAYYPFLTDYLGQRPIASEVVYTPFLLSYKSMCTLTQ